MSYREFSTAGVGLGSSASAVVFQLLRRSAPVEPPLREILEKACLRQLDARSIIRERPCGRPLEPLADAIRRPIPRILDSEALELLLARIREQGLASSFRELIRSFGAMLLKICATEEQRRMTEAWGPPADPAAFLMTDAGGPTLASWVSTVERDRQRARLTVSKIDAIDAHVASFGIVAVRRGHSPLPSFYLLPPETYSRLEHTPIGEPWLHGSFQLANVAGLAAVDSECALTQGGFTGVNLFLTLVRPSFVRALMAHIDWLDTTGSVALSDAQRSAVHNLERIARKAGNRKHYGAQSIDEVLAVKFASNEVLLDVVTSGMVRQERDRRDLLGFTKMEGSSYRCLFELLEKRRKRNGQPQA